jgi:hypothetical protein
MINLLRTTAAVAALALTAVPAAAQTAPDRNATATARIVKPLALYWVQDFDMGTILLSGAGAWTGATVSVSQTGGRTCTNTNVSCSGTSAAAQYRVTGTNNQVVTVNAPDVTLRNANDLTKTLLLDVDGPGTVNLGNSGNTGATFGLGGSIVVDSNTADGTYNGTFAVTVNY